MTIIYEPDRNRFNMPTEAGDAFVSIRWDDDVMVLPHAEVASALRGTGAGARLAKGVFEQIEAIGITAGLTCPFLLKVAKSDPRWRDVFGV